MLRVRMAAVSAVVALLAAACGDDGGGTVAADGPDAQATAATAASPTADTATTTASEPDDGASEADPDEQDGGDGSGEAAPGEAATLLASAIAQLGAGPVRGEATFDFAPGFDLSTSFESDAEGDLAAVVDLPPGLDPQVPSGSEGEFRYVGGVVYVRPPASEETLAELGLDEAWFVAELPPPDPFNDVMGSAGGLLCVFSQMTDAYFDQCDPLGDAGALLEAGRDPEIVGREDVRGTEATRVRFQVSLRDLAGDAFGEIFDGEDAGGAGDDDGAFFDESSTDPFAEGMEEFFALLDAGFQAEAWIDGDNLIRRLAFDLASMFADLAGPDDEVPPTVITIEFFDFGADIDVDAPPPETIVDQSVFVGPSGGGTGGGAGPAVEPIEDPYEDTYDETGEPGP